MLRGGFVFLCDSSILLINLRDPFLSCVLRLLKRALEDVGDGHCTETLSVCIHTVSQTWTKEISMLIA
jgi:hypothetical protein